MRRLTRLVHTPRDPVWGATATPIVQTATFAQRHAERPGPYDYSRSGNPTRDVLEEQLAALEGGCRAVAVSSGMAALDLVLRLVDGPVVAGADLYGGTHRLLRTRACRFIDLRTVQSFPADTALVMVESPTNPLGHVVDLQRIADLAHAVGAVVCVDNSLLGPLLQNPLDQGADLVVHSATKFLGGHGDLTAGAVITADPQLGDRLAWWQNAAGAALAPFDCFLLLRGLKTLGVRQKAQARTARRLERLLRNHPAVSALHTAGVGSVFSFETGCVQASRHIVDATGLFTTCVSFGSVHSSISLPCAMSHASIAPDERRLAHDLVRVSVGLEDPRDLAQDLGLALDRASGILRSTLEEPCA